MEAQLIVSAVTISFYLWAFTKRRSKFKGSYIKGFKNLLRNSIRILSIFVVIGILQSFLSKEMVGEFLMTFSGIKGILIGTLIGAIMMGPVISGYPICRYLLDHGGSYGLVSSFLFSWVMVGLISIPLELRSFGSKFTLLRNTLAFFFAMILALIIEVLL